eukprot:TRINITY_DN7039_c0_g1_i1.p1 TRINITY_DN7039_c0_g1~~TRINITY_DN7039_c0_g1_i1.p1  ORF type:complete len:1343 (-),score=365.01 TRINITY_DN7039_c0_g1_i1:152-4180(-)
MITKQPSKKRTTVSPSRRPYNLSSPNSQHRKNKFRYKAGQNRLETQLLSNWDRKIVELPVHKDVPRLIKNIRVYNEKGVVVFDGKNDKNDRKLLIKSLLMVLSDLLREDDISSIVESQFDKFFSDPQAEIQEQLKNLFTHAGIVDDCRTYRVLKCIQQEILFPPMMELREQIYKQYPYKDQRGSWQVEVEVKTDYVVVRHLKKEQTHAHEPDKQWGFEWHFQIIFNRYMTSFSATVQVIEMNFNPKFKQDDKQKIEEILKKFQFDETPFYRTWRKPLSTITMFTHMPELIAGLKIYDSQSDRSEIQLPNVRVKKIKSDIPEAKHSRYRSDDNFIASPRVSGNFANRTPRLSMMSPLTQHVNIQNAITGSPLHLVPPQHLDFNTVGTDDLETMSPKQQFKSMRDYAIINNNNIVNNTNTNLSHSESTKGASLNSSADKITSNNNTTMQNLPGNNNSGFLTPNSNVEKKKKRVSIRLYELNNDELSSSSLSMSHPPPSSTASTTTSSSSSTSSSTITKQPSSGNSSSQLKVSNSSGKPSEGSVPSITLTTSSVPSSIQTTQSSSSSLSTSNSQNGQLSTSAPTVPPFSPLSNQERDSALDSSMVTMLLLLIKLFEDDEKNQNLLIDRVREVQTSIPTNRLRSIFSNEDEDYRLCRLLKCLRSDLIYHGVWRFRDAFKEKFPFKEQRENHTCTVKVDNVSVTVIHTGTCQSLEIQEENEAFEFSWQIELVYNWAITQLQSVDVSITDWKAPESMNKRMEMEFLIAPFAKQNVPYLIRWKGGIEESNIGQLLVRLAANTTITKEGKIIYEPPDSGSSSSSSSTSPSAFDLLQAIATPLENSTVVKLIKKHKELMSEQKENVSEQILHLLKKIDESSSRKRLIPIIKCFQIKLLTPAIFALRAALFEHFPYKEVKKFWKVDIDIDAKKRITISHRRKEVSNKNDPKYYFELEWVVQFKLGKKMSSFDVEFYVHNWSFGPETTPDVQDSLIKHIKPLLAQDLVYKKEWNKSISPAQLSNGVLSLLKRVEVVDSDGAILFDYTQFGDDDVHEAIYNFVTCLAKKLEGEHYTTKITEYLNSQFLLQQPYQLSTANFFEYVLKTEENKSSATSTNLSSQSQPVLSSSVSLSSSSSISSSTSTFNMASLPQSLLTTSSSSNSFIRLLKTTLDHLVKAAEGELLGSLKEFPCGMLDDTLQTTIMFSEDGKGIRIYHSCREQSTSEMLEDFFTFDWDVTFQFDDLECSDIRLQDIGILNFYFHEQTSKTLRYEIQSAFSTLVQGSNSFKAEMTNVPASKILKSVISTLKREYLNVFVKGDDVLDQSNIIALLESLDRTLKKHPEIPVMVPQNNK